MNWSAAMFMVYGKEKQARRYIGMRSASFAGDTGLVLDDSSSFLEFKSVENIHDNELGVGCLQLEQMLRICTLKGFEVQTTLPCDHDVHFSVEVLM